MRVVALDLGVKKISFCEVRDGVVVKRRTVRSFEELQDELGPGTPPARVALEACREAWAIHDKLMEAGHEPVLVDTTRVKALGVGHHGRKTDRIDADVLALALDANRIPRAHVLSPERRTIRSELAVRRALVETRTQYITTVRGLVRAAGRKLAPCASENFVARFREAELDPVLARECEPLVVLLELLEKQLLVVDQKLEKRVETEPLAKLLMTVPGVGPVVSLMFLSVMDDPKRFRHAHQLESYLGLVPSENTTGGNRRLGAISKCGNSYVRTLLVQAAQSILRAADDDPLRMWGQAIVDRRGRRIAVVALARRLAGVLWAMSRDGTFYDPAMLGKSTAEGLQAQAQSSALRALAMTRAQRKVSRHVSRPVSTRGAAMRPSV